MVIISQYIHISDHHVIYVNFTQSCVNFINKARKKRKKSKRIYGKRMNRTKKKKGLKRNSEFQLALNASR